MKRDSPANVKKTANHKKVSVAEMVAFLQLLNKTKAKAKKV